MTYIEGLLIAFDQFINAALGGWPDETLSSGVGDGVGTACGTGLDGSSTGCRSGSRGTACAPTRANGKGCNARRNCENDSLEKLN